MLLNFVKISAVLILFCATSLEADVQASLRPIARAEVILANAPVVVIDLGPLLETDLVVEGEQPVIDLVRPVAREVDLPKTRWEHREGHAVWTRAALSALKDHGSPLVEMVPDDIATWCPAYTNNGPAGRRAFWVGYMSALAKHESTYRADAVGGGGKWYGLLQILPATARGYKCRVGTGEALKNGAANLSCAARIMAVTVPRDGVIHKRDRRWRGVSADWGPMRNPAKRAEMAGWLRGQTYCQTVGVLRPKLRP